MSNVIDCVDLICKLEDQKLSVLMMEGVCDRALAECEKLDNMLDKLYEWVAADVMRSST